MSQMSCLRAITGLLAALVIIMVGSIPQITEAVESPKVDPPKTTKTRKSALSVPRERVLEISDRIDRYVENKLTSAGEERNPLTTDEVFLRRIYLDAAGRIPTLQETKKFLASKSETKRADLIDELLDSYGYTSRQFNFWADLLRIKSRMPGGLTGRPYVDFVKDSIEDNKPYDEFVREMIESSGPNLERGNGAVGYYLRDRNMPEDNMSNTIRIFLGTRLECAQCHDHPFDKWTQRQYFEMVAFTGGINYRDAGGAKNSMYQKISKQFRNKDVPEKLRPILNRMRQTLQHGIRGEGTGLARLPENFLGDDGYDGEIIVAKEMFSGKPLTEAAVPKVKNKKQAKRRPDVQQAAIPGAKDVGSRSIYAQWLTDAENPRFATVIANRLWRQAMGVGLIEPVDILEDDTEASNPELMDYLAKQIVELDFDMKQFLRAIYNSKTYQAVAYRSDITDPAKFNFSGPKVRRMSAEQIWDSLLVLTIPTVDRRYDQLDNGNQDPYEMYERLSNVQSMDQVLKIAEEIANSRKKKKYNYKDDPAVKKMQAQKSEIQQKIRQAKKRRDTEQVRKLMIEQAKITTNFRRSRLASQFQRASELNSPAPAGHFLREFGQSDRETIDNSNTEPAVTQVLAMMNGYVEERIARDQSSVLMQSALTAKTAKECIEVVFLSMLNRKPKSKEIRVWQREFDAAFPRKGAPDQAKIRETFTDLIWTLANSNEFIFQK